jgi:pSer/pThr/pTyr-binding forkhead associated (FHA) protein
MPLTLVLRTSEASSGGAAPALTFDGGRVVIGRGPNCDVRLPDPSVSHRHASVRANGSEYTLVDEKSTNGTFVGGERLAPNTPRTLKHGEFLRVGRVWLQARIDQTPATRDLAFATRDLALALVSQAMRGLGEEAASKVRVIEGRDVGAELVLADEARAYIIGRDGPSDLPLADVDVSRTHVQVVRRGGTVLVRDLGSKNGARLGDAMIPVERDVPWKSGAILRIGNTAMELEDPAAIALAELEAAEDEPIEPGDVPAQPSPTELAPSAGSPTLSQPGAAPIVRLPTTSRPPTSSRASTLSATDVAVVLAALAVLALSIAGLVWLLRV